MSKLDEIIQEYIDPAVAQLPETKKAVKQSKQHIKALILEMGSSLVLNHEQFKYLKKKVEEL